MENEELKSVLTELLEGQKEIAQYQNELMSAMTLLKPYLEQIVRELKNPETKKASVDLEAIRQLIAKATSDLKFQIDILRQSSTNNLRIFLESDAKKWAVYLLVALMFLTYLYWFAVR